VRNKINTENRFFQPREGPSECARKGLLDLPVIMYNILRSESGFNKLDTFGVLVDSACFDAESPRAVGFSGFF